MVLKNLKDTHHIYRQGKQGGRPREGGGKGLGGGGLRSGGVLSGQRRQMCVNVAISERKLLAKAPPPLAEGYTI